MSPDVIFVQLDDGRKLIHKGVPRQERRIWRPGEPWTELVWIDFLAASGMPVPRLVAADVHNGWLVEEFVDGRLLSESFDADVFEQLVDSIRSVEKACANAPDDVRAFASEPSERPLEVDRERIARWLSSEAQSALDALLSEAFAGAKQTLGPLDIRPENALRTADEVILIDMATIGYDFFERRLAGYTWRVRPRPCSPLDVACYRQVEREMGRPAALRLAFYDFAHCVGALDRIHIRAPDAASVGGTVAQRGVEDALLGVRAEWRRERVDDARVNVVRFGLRTT